MPRTGKCNWSAQQWLRRLAPRILVLCRPQWALLCRRAWIRTASLRSLIPPRRCSQSGVSPPCSPRPVAEPLSQRRILRGGRLTVVHGLQSSPILAHRFRCLRKTFGAPCLHPS